MLEETGLSVAGFHSMRFTDGASWWQYMGSKNYALGTSLCYRREWWQANKFSLVNVGEDNTMVWAAQHAKQIVSEDAGELMVASVHSKNTSPRMIADNWKTISGPQNFFNL